MGAAASGAAATQSTCDIATPFTTAGRTTARCCGSQLTMTGVPAWLICGCCARALVACGVVLHANVTASAANPNVAPAAGFHRFVNPMALMSSPFARTVLGASRTACHDLLQGGCQASRAPISSIFGQNSLTLARSQVWCCPQNGSTGGLNVRHVLRATVLRCNVQIRA